MNKARIDQSVRI